MFEKGLFIFGVVALATFVLFTLSIYYSTNWLHSLYEEFLELQGLF